MAATSGGAPAGAARKYDLLTALAVSALGGGATARTSALRLIALVTARYDWRADAVAAGTADLARLWSVSERSAKRELARLRAAGLLVLKRPGQRGRVACYGLGHDAIARLTAAGWARVGPDFAGRMAAGGAAPDAEEDGAGAPDRPGGGLPSLWDATRRRLAAENPALFRAWFGSLAAGPGGAPDRLVLAAPSAFVADYVTTHHRARIERAAAAARGRPVAVEIRAP